MENKKQLKELEDRHIGQNYDEFSLEDIQAELEDKEYVEWRVYAQGYGYDGGAELRIVTYRWETDEETAKRVQKEEERRLWYENQHRKGLEEQEAKDRALYEKLKEKYGNS